MISQNDSQLFVKVLNLLLERNLDLFQEHKVVLGKTYAAIKEVFGNTNGFHVVLKDDCGNKSFSIQLSVECSDNPIYDDVMTFDCIDSITKESIDDFKLSHSIDNIVSLFN